MDRTEIHRVIVVGASIVLGSATFADDPPRKRLPHNELRSLKNSLIADWPHWRGPDAGGVADCKNLPIRWGETENVRWSVKLPGWGTSSPVVYGKRVFVTSEVKEGGRDRKS